MQKDIRCNQIRWLLIKDKIIQVKALSEKFNVSERTIRRDLKQLVDDGIAELFFGGARLKDITHDFNKLEMRNLMNCKLDLLSPEEGDTNLNTHTYSNGVYVLGSFNIDIVSEVVDFPKVGETVHSKLTAFHPGGKGSNQATAAAQVCDNVHFCVKIGNDEFGNKAKKYFATTNIKSFNVLESEKTPTGSAIIFVSLTNGENFISIDLSSNGTITEEEISAEFTIIKNSKVFLTQLENNIEITKLAIEYAKRSGVTIMLNPAPYTTEVIDLLTMVDIITPNETEAECLTGIKVNDLDSAKIAAKKIFDMGPSNIVITLGSRGALLFDGQKYKHVKSYKALVVDSSGAGDAFNGAMAATLANGKSIEYAMEYASAFASLAVERRGASNMPENNIVMKRLEIAGSSVNA